MALIGRLPDCALNSGGPLALAGVVAVFLVLGRMSNSSEITDSGSSPSCAESGSASDCGD